MSEQKGVVEKMDADWTTAEVVKTALFLAVLVVVVVWGILWAIALTETYKEWEPRQGGNLVIPRNEEVMQETVK